MPDHCNICDTDLILGQNWNRSSYDNFVMRCNNCVKKTHKRLKDKIKSRRKQKHLSEEEVERLKAVCVSFSDQLIVYGLLYTGMRVNELCHLHKGWIHLKDATICIPEEEDGWHPKIVHVWDKENNKPKKSYCSNRTVAILNPILIKILEQVVNYNYTLGMNPHDVWVRVNQLWRATGSKERISPHMLRHTCLTFMCRKGISITSVAAHAGHHSIEVTMRDYIHPDQYYAVKEIKEKGGI